MAYESIYNQPIDIAFKYDDKWFKQSRTGFAALFDPDDPILKCQMLECPDEPENQYRRFGHLSDSLFPNMQQFKIFIPKYCVEIDLVFYMPIAGQIGVASRFGQPPKTIRAKEFNDHTWTRTPSSPQDFIDHDILLRNSGGHIQVMGRPFPAMQNSGWLYFKILNWNSHIYKYSLTMKVELAPYRKWFYASKNNPELKGSIGQSKPLYPDSGGDGGIVVPEEPLEPDPTNIEYSRPKFANWIERARAQRMARTRTINPIIATRDEANSIDELKHIYGLVLEEGTLTPVLNELAAQLQTPVKDLKYDLWVYFGMTEK